VNLEELAVACDRVVTTAQLAECAIDHNGVVSLRRAGQLVRLYQRTYAVPPVTEPAFLLSCRGAVAYGGRGAVVLGESALACVSAYPAPLRVDVGVPRTRSVRSTPGLRAVRCADPLLVARRAHGLPVQDPARAVAWAWSRLDRRDDRYAVLCAAVDAGATTAHDVRATLSSLRSLRGASAITEACDYVEQGCESPAEIGYLVRVERAFGLPRGERQATIAVPGGRRRRVDVRYGRVVVEIDGDHHRLDPDRVADDHVRDVVLTALGYTVLRVPASEVRHAPGLVAATVRAALARAA
jgi:hypothetical protein